MGKRKVYIWIMIWIMITMAIGMVACGHHAEDEDLPDEEKWQVYASLFPLADFAQKIGGERVEVHHLMPPGVEGHDFEPKPKDMAALHEADLFIYNGAGYEAWIDKAIENLEKGETHLVNATEGLNLMTYEESGHVHDQDDDMDHEHANEESHDHDPGAYDPHVWLDPNLAKLQAIAIKDALISIDEAHAQVYETNYEELAAKFDALDAELRAISEQADRTEIIVSHAAFGYLTYTYGLEQLPISGLSPSDEPTQREMQHLIEFAEEHDVDYIMFETIVNSKVAEAIKNEVGAEALVLHPLENVTKEEHENGEDYFSIMEQNITNLKKAVITRR